MPGFGIHLFNLVEDISHVRTVGIALVRTKFLLFLIFLHRGPSRQIAFLHHTERTDDGHRKLTHAQPGRHGGELSLKTEVQQGGMQNVILVMSQSNLVASQFLGRLEKHFRRFQEHRKQGLFRVSVEASKEVSRI